jgi:uncharacterized protein YneR
MIKLSVTKAAAEQLVKELKLKAGDGVKFYPDSNNHHPVVHGPHQLYAIDNHPDRVVAKDTVGEINFHINFEDEWFFIGREVTVDFTPADGLTFTFVGNDVNAAATIDYEKFLM